MVRRIEVWTDYSVALHYVSSDLHRKCIKWSELKIVTRT